MTNLAVFMRFAFLLLLLGLSALVVPRAAAQISELPAPDTSSTLGFGVAVAIDGDRAVVGASGENVCGPNSGAAYVYERDSLGTWHQAARLTPSRCLENGFFGRTLALDGARVIAGVSSEFFAREEANAAYLFERGPDSTWSEVARLVPDRIRSEGAFAADVDLDGDLAVVSTAGVADSLKHGAAYVYGRTPGGTWRQEARLTTSGDPRQGLLGGDLALSGGRLAVAASTGLRRRPGSVYLFARAPSGTWVESAHLTGIDDFFIGLDLAGRRLLVGETRADKDASGVASLFTWTPERGWARAATLRPTTPYAEGAFGAAVSIGATHALVTGYDEQLSQDFNIDRVVFVFVPDDLNPGAWRQQRMIDIGEVDFGTAIAHDGTTALVSSVPANGPGSVYVVRLP